MNKDERAKLLNEAINVGDEVKTLVESQTWQKYIEPMFDALIGSVLGEKIDGRWTNGSLDDRELSEKRLRELQAYKAGIVAVHQAIYGMIDDADRARREIKQAHELYEEFQDQNYYKEGEL